jgi:hypothetical protein
MTDMTDIIVPPYHVQSTALKLKNGFPYFAHHDSISSLWAQKWRPPCEHGIYPFSDGNVLDFDPIFQELIEMSGDSSDILFRPDDYASAFFPAAEQLVKSAEKSEEEGDIEKARDLYLRAAAVYRIARFPINRSQLTQLAWERGKAAYLKGGRYLSPPNIAVEIALFRVGLYARVSTPPSRPIRSSMKACGCHTSSSRATRRIDKIRRCCAPHGSICAPLGEFRGMSPTTGTLWRGLSNQAMSRS